MPKAKPRIRVRPKPVPKPILAIATPSGDRPVVVIEKLKGGELNWSVRVPAASLGVAAKKALEEAMKLQASLDAWQNERKLNASSHTFPPIRNGETVTLGSNNVETQEDHYRVHTWRCRADGLLEYLGVAPVPYETWTGRKEWAAHPQGWPGAGPMFTGPAGPVTEDFLLYRAREPGETEAPPGTGQSGTPTRARPSRAARAKGPHSPSESAPTP